MRVVRAERMFNSDEAESAAFWACYHPNEQKESSSKLIRFVLVARPPGTPLIFSVVSSVSASSPVAIQNRRSRSPTGVACFWRRSRQNVFKDSESSKLTPSTENVVLS